MESKTVLNEFAADLRRVSRNPESTIRSYVRDLKLVSQHVDDLLRASHGELLSALGALADAGYAAARQRRVVAATRKFYGFAIRMGAREDNPAEALPRPSLARRLPVVTDGSGVSQLISAAAKETPFYALRDQAIVVILAGCGLRRDEAAALETRDIDLERGVVRVRHGKGDKEREVPIVDGASILSRHMERVGEGRLFSGPRGPMTGAGIWRVVKRLADTAGLEDITPHTLRRTYATSLHEGGADIYAISAALGHSSVITTQRYVRANPRKVIVERNLYGLESAYV